ncbi:MAG: hypothetical protein PV344_08845, partial [Anaplasma sp.]|nr:hypothetical protein [Anaplasma sp.]
GREKFSPARTRTSFPPPCLASQRRWRDAKIRDWSIGIMTSQPHDLAREFPATHNVHVKRDVTCGTKVITR